MTSTSSLPSYVKSPGITFSITKSEFRICGALGSAANEKLSIKKVSYTLIKGMFATGWLKGHTLIPSVYGYRCLISAKHKEVGAVPKTKARLNTEQVTLSYILKN
jgi:hypothetical protein